MPAWRRWRYRQSEDKKGKEVKIFNANQNGLLEDEELSPVTINSSMAADDRTAIIEVEIYQGERDLVWDNEFLNNFIFIVICLTLYLYYR